MDSVDQLLDKLPVDDLIKSLQKLTEMGWGGLVFTIILTAAVVLLKIWWDRNKKGLKQGRTEYERNKERANTATENQQVQDGWTEAERELERARAEAAGSPGGTTGDEGGGSPSPKPKRPQQP